MSIEDWGSYWGPMPWGGATNCEGWGGRWGSMPWGGKCTEVPVVPPPTGTAGWGRFERVTRERREEREQREIRSVLFKVSGLRATGELGEPSILGGYGRAVQLRQFRRGHGALGIVAISVDIAPTPTPLLAVAHLGEAQVLNETQPTAELSASRGRVGKPSITAQRNLSDDELIHMIAEML
jgi:hypothetical protein